ncbi:hypothetical protein L7F22_013625 [Adiantum nelumboides]|nr:hypothetical protein [Adiantum nelumboides]
MKGGLVQQIIKGLTNALFGLFMVGVLIFTVVSVRYQPPDPWLEPGEAVTKLVLNSVVPNATFQTDDSVLHTGEDFALSAADNTTVALVEEPAITEEQIKVQQITVSDVAEEGSHDAVACSSQDKPINCSDPVVLTTIVSYNLQQLPDLNFFSYQVPVQGLGDDECDVAWKFRAKKEKSWRMYRDFRRFTLVVDATCNMTVLDAGPWHSGKNAKHLVARRSGPFAGRILPKRKPRPAQSITEKNVTVMEEVEVIEDSVAKADVSTFQQNRYLFYGRGGDHCKKMSHYLWSFLCALGEAQYLNRTLVLDLNLCLSSTNNPGHADEDGKDFRFYFDFAHLKDSASVIEQGQFLGEWGSWNQQHPHNQATYREIVGNAVTPMDLQQETSTIIMRKFELPEPDNYWYRVCEGETENVVQRPWHLLWKSKRIMDIVNAICGQMEWDFDAVHVVRGDKASNKELWPNLDTDTSSESLLNKLRDTVDTSRFLYIATNEREPGYFDAVKDVYRHAYTLDDFSALWAKDSLWYNQTLELTNGNPVEFDGYMRAEVDTEVTLRAKQKIETFGFLTNDCKDGVNTC